MVMGVLIWIGGYTRLSPDCRADPLPQPARRPSVGEPRHESVLRSRAAPMGRARHQSPQRRYTLRWNPRQRYPQVDDKLRTKAAVRARRASRRRSCCRWRATTSRCDARAPIKGLTRLRAEARARRDGQRHPRDPGTRRRRASSAAGGTSLDARGPASTTPPASSRASTRSAGSPTSRSSKSVSIVHPELAAIAVDGVPDVPRDRVPRRARDGDDAAADVALRRRARISTRAPSAPASISRPGAAPTRCSTTARDRAPRQRQALRGRAIPEFQARCSRSRCGATIRRGSATSAPTSCSMRRAAPGRSARAERTAGPRGAGREPGTGCCRACEVERGWRAASRCDERVALGMRHRAARRRSAA